MGQLQVSSFSQLEASPEVCDASQERRQHAHGGWFIIYHWLDSKQTGRVKRPIKKCMWRGAGSSRHTWLVGGEGSTWEMLLWGPAVPLARLPSAPGRTEGTAASLWGLPHTCCLPPRLLLATRRQALPRQMWTTGFPWTICADPDLGLSRGWEHRGARGTGGRVGCSGTRSEAGLGLGRGWDYSASRVPAQLDDLGKDNGVSPHPEQLGRQQMAALCPSSHAWDRMGKSLGGRLLS